MYLWRRQCYFVKSMTHSLNYFLWWVSLVPGCRQSILAGYDASHSFATIFLKIRFRLLASCMPNNNGRDVHIDMNSYVVVDSCIFTPSAQASFEELREKNTQAERQRAQGMLWDLFGDVYCTLFLSNLVSSNLSEGVFVDGILATSCSHNQSESPANHWSSGMEERPNLWHFWISHVAM